MVIATSNTPLPPASFDRRWLMPDELHALDGQRVAAVAVDQGEVWVTFDARDLVVCAGQTVLIDTADRVLIQTVSPGRADIRITWRPPASDEAAADLDKALTALKL